MGGDDRLCLNSLLCVTTIALCCVLSSFSQHAPSALLSLGKPPCFTSKRYPLFLF